MKFERIDWDSVSRETQKEIKSLLSGYYQEFIDKVDCDMTQLYLVNGNTYFAFTVKSCDLVHLDLLIGSGLNDVYYAIRDYLKQKGVKYFTGLTHKKGIMKMYERLGAEKVNDYALYKVEL